MSLTIQLKRGLKANLPASAPAGELYTTTDTKELNIGTGAAVVPVKVDYANLLNVPASTIPAPTTTTLGGVKSKAAVASNFLTQVGTDGVIAAAQPAFSDISGAATQAQLPSIDCGTF